MHTHIPLCNSKILMWLEADGLLNDCVEQARSFIGDKQDGDLKLFPC